MSEFPDRPEAYLKASKDPTKRLYCDFCTRCIMYDCDGSTARHHHIHINLAKAFAMSDEEFLHDYIRKMGFAPDGE